MKLQSACWPVLAFLLAAPMFAQTVSSTLKGTVQDKSGAVIPGAACKLLNTATTAVLNTTSAQDGSFQFLDILAGTYTLTVSAPGFKNYEGDRYRDSSSGSLGWQLCCRSDGHPDAIFIVAENGTPVQVSSGERSDTVTGRELNDIAVKGRDFMSYLSTAISFSSRPTVVRRSPLSGTSVQPR